MVNVYQLKFTNLQQEIMRVLFIRAGTQLNQRRIAVILGVSQPAVVKALPLLEKEGLIKISQDKESKRWAIELNRENPKVLQMKRIDNLKLLYDSGLVDYLEKELAGAQIMLVGDYSTGKDILSSNIALVIIGAKKKNLDLSTFEKSVERLIKLNYHPNLNVLHKKMHGGTLILPGGTAE